MATMPSSLEIAQEATLRPIAEIAEELGLQPDEYDLYGQVQGQGRPVGRGPARGPARRKARLRHRDHADEGRRGQDDDLRLAHAGARPHRPAGGALPARGLARPRLRDQGRRGRRRLRAGRPHGGPEPPLHRGHPRDRGGQQPARGHARGAPPAREQARHRPALDQLAALRRHQRPRAPADHGRARRARERLPARDRVRHHRGLRGHGHPGRGPGPPRPAQATRCDHGRLHVGGRARRRRAAPGGGGDDRPPQGRDQAEPRADAGRPGRVRPLRAVRQHRARQQLARGGPGRAEARRVRRHRVRLRLGHGHGEVPRHRLPHRRPAPERGLRRGDRARAQAPRRRSGRRRRRDRAGRREPAPPRRHRQGVRAERRRRGEPLPDRHGRGARGRPQARRSSSARTRRS